ncbi:hypothetical protein BJ166DRAFT_521015 [Pestalotiopsis sp. NC0098]|nr:hypothetical protein BJ166DRAFT_521015 [Pestalotiopsis sp. NC0098]
MGAVLASIPSDKQDSDPNGPALPPPPGVVPNFDDPPNSNTMARAVMSTCLAIGSLFYLVRIYGTWFVVKKPRSSDYVMIPTFIIYLAFIGVFFAEGRYGFFVHLWDIRLRDLPPIIYLWTCRVTLYGAELMTIKTAILLEWLHLFCPTGARNRFWWTAHILLYANIVFYCAAILALHLSCVPHARIWDKTVPGRCVDTRPLDIASAIVNFVVDVGILLLPQRVIWRLRMSTRKRMGVSAVFGLGIVVLVFAGTRTVFTIVRASAPSASADFTWNASLMGLLFAVEVTLGVVIFCLPVVPKALDGFPAWCARLKSSLRGGRFSSSGASREDRTPPWPRSSWAPVANSHRKRELSVFEEGGMPASLGNHRGCSSETWSSSHNDSIRYFSDEQYALTQWAKRDNSHDGRVNHEMEA